MFVFEKLFEVIVDSIGMMYAVLSMHHFLSIFKSPNFRNTNSHTHTASAFQLEFSEIDIWNHVEVRIY